MSCECEFTKYEECADCQLRSSLADCESAVGGKAIRVKPSPRLDQLDGDRDAW